MCHIYPAKKKRLDLRIGNESVALLNEQNGDGKTHGLGVLQEAIR